jgi:surfeit locus 1 family protein
LPIGGVTIIDLPNSHLQYAVTWYGLAVALAAIVAISWWRKHHPDAPSQ